MQEAKQASTGSCRFWWKSMWLRRRANPAFWWRKPENAIREIAKLSNIRVEGLMTIAPFVENAEENRQYFVKLRKLSVDIAAKNIDNVTMHHLSMGMTGDYEVAIEEGATMVRVGTGIFGERNYQIG